MPAALPSDAPIDDTAPADAIDVRDIGLRGDALADPDRLAAVRATGLLDTEVEEVFDRLTRLAVRLLRIPAAFISLVDAERDFYKSACGFGEPLASARELTGPTFCHYTIQRTEPLVIPDTAADPLYRNVPTVRSLGVAAYVGVPLIVDGHPIGAFCAIDMKPHAWTEDEVEVLVELAASANREIELRGAIAASHAARDAAEEANQSKARFLTNMSHELRTPLNAIGGYAELMEMGLEGPVTAKQIVALGRIRRSQRHLLGLINGILDYAKIGAGALHYDITDVPVDEILVNCEALVAPQVRAKNLDFRYERCNAELIVRADRQRMQQIVVNLVSNAVKFTEPNGHIAMDCTVSGDTVVVLVADTGRGIAPDQLDRVFQPFVQVDANLTRTKEGTGLGLAISRELARGMHGDLTAKSTPGVGSTFILTLPLARSGAS